MSIDDIDKSRLPEHVAIIMDGNGRWAKKKGGIRLLGHKSGADSVNDVVEASVELGLKYLTLYAFSTENWSRPKDEVSGLMKLLVNTINTKIERLLKYNVRLQTIGNLNDLPVDVRNKLTEAIKKTENNEGLVLTLALSYSSRWEVSEAVKKICTDVKMNNLSAEDIDYNLFRSYLSTANTPDPELLIRTSGELRISNFLLLQIAYAELYFTDTLWPDFGKHDLFAAIADFQNRERRFGLTTEQISRK